jgi:LysR family nod box-dependent transcriptional activator
MRFNRLDLNLLLAPDALLEEQNITRAAVRVNVSQSAMSAMLARLREFFEDDLLGRWGATWSPPCWAANWLVRCAT